MNTKKYLITTRLDDDDSLCKNFTNIIWSHVQKTKITGFLILSFETGYFWYANPQTEYGVFKLSTKAFIALGLTLITNIRDYPFTIYFCNHTKIPFYLRNPDGHKLLAEFCKKNNERPADFKSRYAIVRRTEPIYIRTVHDYNLQKDQTNVFSHRKIDMSKSNLDKIFKTFNTDAPRVSAPEVFRHRFIA